MNEQTDLPTNVGSTARLGVITRAEWEARYAAQVRKRAGWTHEEAAECARVGAETYEEQERSFGNEVMWWGGPSGALNTPEDEADEEMSYWDDDGEV
jgi:hypothetical protein